MAQAKKVVPFVQSDVPAHLSGKGALGNENVSAEDQAIPRLTLLQKLSPQLDESAAEFVDGAKAGQYFNSLTNIASDGLYVVNLMYRRTVAVFKKRAAGGGFAGNFASKQEALDDLAENGNDPSMYDFSDTGNHYLLLLDADGKPTTPVIFSMAGSKLRVSNTWNSKIAAAAEDMPRFATVWKLTAVSQSNAKGSWHNTAVDYMGFAAEDLFEVASEYYAQFQNEA